MGLGLRYLPGDAVVVVEVVVDVVVVTVLVVETVVVDLSVVEATVVVSELPVASSVALDTFPDTLISQIFHPMDLKPG